VPLALASTVFLGHSPLGLVTVFCCLRFETSLFVTSYDSQGHGGGGGGKFWKSIFINIALEAILLKYKIAVINSQHFCFVEGGYSNSIES
jgi:hypothetical protein